MFSKQSIESWDKNFYYFLLKILEHHSGSSKDLWTKTHDKLKSKPSENIHFKKVFHHLLEEAISKSPDSLEWKTLVMILKIVSDIEKYLSKPGSFEEIIKWRKCNGRANFISNCHEKKAMIIRLLRKRVEKIPSFNDKQGFLIDLEQNTTALQPLDLNNLCNFNAFDHQSYENDMNFNNIDYEIPKNFSQRPTGEDTLELEQNSMQSMNLGYIAKENCQLKGKELAYSNFGDEEEKLNMNMSPHQFFSMPSPLNNKYSQFHSGNQQYEDREENRRLIEKNRELEKENMKLKEENEKFKKILNNIHSFSYCEKS